MITNIKHIVKKIGFTAAALALAAGLASAPAASASSLSSIGTSPIVQNVNTGKLSVAVETMSASALNPLAIVTVYNEKGEAVAKAETSPNSNIVGFVLAEGIYKVVVTAQGFQPTGDYVKVVANDSTDVKFLLTPASSSVRGGSAR